MISVIALVVVCIGSVSACLVKVDMEGATATSVGWGGVASRTIDGSINGVYGGQSCYHSQNNRENSVTAQLKGHFLGITYPISTVKVYNRMDTCCDQRIDGATVWAGDHMCGTIVFDAAKVVYEFDCDGTEASTVSVALNGEYLQVCEIEVMVDEDRIPVVPEYHNAALGRPTTQSSIGWGGASSRAVDGNANQYWGGRSCTHTGANTGNWWSVELDNEEYVNSVIVHNRMDCCQDRIDLAQVWLKRGDEYVLCGTIEYDESVSVYSIECGQWGSEVKITNDNSWLTLCEVEVIVMEEAPSEAMDEDVEAFQ